jgi:hypothetical protein
MATVTQCQAVRALGTPKCQHASGLGQGHLQKQQVQKGMGSENWHAQLGNQQANTQEACLQGDYIKSGCFTMSLPSTHKSLLRKWTHWDGSYGFLQIPPVPSPSPTGLCHKLG